MLGMPLSSTLYQKLSTTLYQNMQARQPQSHRCAILKRLHIAIPLSAQDPTLPKFPQPRAGPRSYFPQIIDRFLKMNMASVRQDSRSFRPAPIDSQKKIISSQTPSTLTDALDAHICSQKRKTIYYAMKMRPNRCAVPKDVTPLPLSRPKIPDYLNPHNRSKLRDRNHSANQGPESFFQQILDYRIYLDILAIKNEYDVRTRHDSR